MRLHKTTLILLCLASIAGGLVYIHEIWWHQQVTIQAENRRIFTFSQEDVIALRIEKGEQIFEFERQKNDYLSWGMKKPEDTPASRASVYFLLNLLVEENDKQSFLISASQKSEYGLDKPFAKIKITLNNQTHHEIILGKPNFDNSLIYAQIDQQLTVRLLPINFKQAVEKNIQDWTKG